jgi:hypothetical protein
VGEDPSCRWHKHAAVSSETHTVAESGVSTPCTRGFCRHGVRRIPSVPGRDVERRCTLVERVPDARCARWRTARQLEPPRPQCFAGRARGDVVAAPARGRGLQACDGDSGKVVRYDCGTDRAMASRALPTETRRDRPTDHRNVGQGARDQAHFKATQAAPPTRHKMKGTAQTRTTTRPLGRTFEITRNLRRGKASSKRGPVVTLGG